MTRVTEIKREISATKKEMRELGVRRISCFNGGLSPAESRYNSRLFQLKCDLERAEKDAEFTQAFTPNKHGEYA